MSTAETAAYIRGVRDVIALARASADAIEAKARRPLHDAFAVEALRALADEAEALIAPPPTGGKS
jgi:hypothetical protein